VEEIEKQDRTSAQVGEILEINDCPQDALCRRRTQRRSANVGGHAFISLAQSVAGEAAQ